MWGGALTPIGDPPLFLGYLKGIPFWWVLQHCWPMWCFAVGILLTVFYLLDSFMSRGVQREHRHSEDPGPVVSLFGASNLLLVFAILAGVLLHDDVNSAWASLHLTWVSHIPFRELVMIAATSISLWTTPQRIHSENVFNFAPIREVALLFIGIFATMVPALNYLAVHSHDPAVSRFLNTPGQFYFSSGALSSVLDNAPTYVTFLEAELGKLDPDERDFVASIFKSKGRPLPDDIEAFARQHPEKFPNAADREKFRNDVDRIFDTIRSHNPAANKDKELPPSEVDMGIILGTESRTWYVIAISLGSVFFGAMTYIFMIKSIADNAGAPTPSFFGYIVYYSAPILLPTLILVWAIFLRPHLGT